ncbi:MAG: ATP-binding protein [Spiroplasma ixodetis]|nr:ATP-binding protein [Spiroplasma ixodetis]
MQSIYINDFSIQNYRKFDNEIKLNFVAENKKYKLKNTIKTVILEKKKKYYNTAIGIIGQNTSGKTTIFNALNIYLYFNNEGMLFRARELTPFGIREAHTYLINNYDYNNLDKPIIFKLNVTTWKNNFIHVVTFKNPFSFNEKIFVVKNNKEKEIWNQDSFNNNKYNFLKLYLLLSSQLNKNNELSNELKEFGKALHNLIQSIFIFNYQNDKEKFLQETFNEFFLQNKVFNDKKMIENKINLIIKTLDDKVEKVNFKLRTDNNQQILVLESVQLKNKNIIPIGLLSVGTLKFLSKILSILRSSIQSENSYVFMDELDNSWHPKLSKIFIKLFQMQIFNNVILIFTAQNPYIFDELRKDAIYIFDNNDNFIQFNKHVNTYNSSIRNDYVFSKNYLNNKIGLSPSDDKFEKFCKEISNFKNEI